MLKLLPFATRARSMASKPGSQGVRLLTLIGLLVLSGPFFYDVYDALSTGATKAPGHNNNHAAVAIVRSWPNQPLPDQR
jgi:hypothetical protein